MLQELYHIILLPPNLFQSTGKAEKLVLVFNEGSMTLKHKFDEYIDTHTHKQEHPTYRSMTLINVGRKILNKILLN